jgi:hypothetical protein
MAAKNHVFLSECQTTLRLHKRISDVRRLSAGTQSAFSSSLLARTIRAVAHRESRAAPQAGAIAPWPSPPIARTLPRSLSLFLAGKVTYPAIIKCPVTRVNPNIFCSLTRVRFGAPAFVSPRLPFLRARPRGEPWKLRAQGCGGYVQARTVGATTIWSGSGGGRQGRGLLTAAGRVCLSVYMV